MKRTHAALLIGITFVSPAGAQMAPRFASEPQADPRRPTPLVPPPPSATLATPSPVPRRETPVGKVALVTQKVEVGAVDSSTAGARTYPTPQPVASSGLTPTAPIADELAARTPAGAYLAAPVVDAEEPSPRHEPKWWTNENAMTMSAVVLAFGLLVMLIGGYLATRRLNTDAVLKIVVIPMVIMSAVFLVVAGYDDQQIAPAMGLLGTVVGYVLGTTKNTPPAVAPVSKDEGPSEDSRRA